MLRENDDGGFSAERRLTGCCVKEVALAHCEGFALCEGEGMMAPRGAAKKARAITSVIGWNNSGYRWNLMWYACSLCCSLASRHCYMKHVDARR